MIDWILLGLTFLIYSWLSLIGYGLVILSVVALYFYLISYMNNDNSF